MSPMSKRAEHGLRAAVRLARVGGGGPTGRYTQSRDLAEGEDLPTKFLEAILLVLRRGGILESKVGSGGGYRLTRAPAEITVAELLAVLDPPEPCDVTADTIGGRAVRLLHERLTTGLDTATADLSLEDLADEADPAGKRDAMYYI